MGSVSQALGSQIVIIAHGSNEAMCRPVPSALRFMPRRWRRAGWMDPRPYFSEKLKRGVPQRVESSIRWRVKVLLIRLFGYVRWSDRNEFEDDLNALVDAASDDSTTVILMTAIVPDSRYFPHADTSFPVYNEVIRDVAKKRGAVCCDVVGHLEEWDDFLADHFHPNARGHEAIAALLETVVQRSLIGPKSTEPVVGETSTAA